MCLLTPFACSVALALGAGGPGTPPDPASDPTFACVETRPRGVEARPVTEAKIRDCQGELFAGGGGRWGHMEDPESGPVVLEPGGMLLVGIRIEEGKSLPPAFVAPALRHLGQGKAAAEVGRVLCQRESESSDRAPGKYRCPVPADIVALKLAFEGFGTEVLWDLSLPAGGTASTNVSLAPAVRLVGSVESSGLSARLVPRGLETGGPEAELAGVVRALPEGGPFELPGISAGAYVYRLEAATGAFSEIDVVVPEGTTEVTLPRIREPIDVTLEVQVDPPLDGTGETWGLTLIPRSGSRRGVRPIVGRADFAGWAKFERIGAGEYLLMVTDSADSLWLTEELSLADDEFQPLNLTHVKVKGRASVGDEPFVGDLIFGTTHGSRRIKFRTDDRGRFRGILPREGLWKVELGLAELGCDACGDTPGTIRVPSVEVEEGPSGVALVEIEIPDTRVRGRVVREELLPTGESVTLPQEGALVFVVRVSGPREGQGRRAQVWSDADGEFELWGIEPGELQIGAMMGKPTRESAWKSVHVDEDREPPWVELTLEEKSSLTVQVASAGRPVGAAQVTALILDGMSANGATGPNGTVTLEVPPRKAGTLVVVAPGFGAVLEDLPLLGTGGEQPARLVIELSPAHGSLALTQLRADVLDRGWLTSGRGGALPLRTLWNLLPEVTTSGVRITIAGLSPETYNFCLGQDRCWQGVVFADAVTEVDLSAEE